MHRTFPKRLWSGRNVGAAAIAQTKRFVAEVVGERRMPTGIGYSLPIP